MCTTQCKVCHICPILRALVLTKNNISVKVNPPVCASALTKMIFLMLTYNKCFYPPIFNFTALLKKREKITKKIIIF